MANTYFDFKQFRIEQADCANKVSTDACVFGAYLAQYLKGEHILDIGTGSGLLSLMIAQKNQCQITGIEIEEACAMQAIDNVLHSKFNQGIEIIQTDIRTYTPSVRHDTIISNPPFYNHSQPNADDAKNKARQTATLGPEDWPNIIQNCAHQNTVIYLLLSNNDVALAYQKELTNAGFIHQEIIEILDKENAPCKRIILIAGIQKPSTPEIKSIQYKDELNNYTPQFIELLKDYYLYL